MFNRPYIDLTRLGQFTDVFSTTITNTITTVVPADGAEEAIIQVETQDIRVTFDGSNPTAARGFLLMKAEPYYVLRCDDLADAKFFRNGSSDGVLNILYRKTG